LLETTTAAAYETRSCAKFRSIEFAVRLRDAPASRSRPFAMA